MRTLKRIVLRVSKHIVLTPLGIISLALVAIQQDKLFLVALGITMSVLEIFDRIENGIQ